LSIIRQLPLKRSPPIALSTGKANDQFGLKNSNEHGLLPDITTFDSLGTRLDLSDLSGVQWVQGIATAIAIMWSTSFPAEVY